MKSATLFAAAIAVTALAGVAQAQTQTQGSTTAPAQNTMSAPDHNQAVATTSADTATAAHGSNSFTMRQARHRIMKHGFTKVKDLTKDDQGVWHGAAMQNGSAVKVWEDYKGSVGTE